MQIRKKGDEIKKKSSPLKLLSQSQPNFAEMILGWFPFKIMFVSAVLYPRWPPLLKIEISSNGQNCSILRQKVPNFELYKHNDEPFNIYFGIFKGRTARHIFGREPSNDYFINILFLLSKWFQTRGLLWEFPIWSYVKLSSAVAAILVGVLKCRTQFWKKTTQESVVSEEKIFFKFHPPFFLICIIGQNRSFKNILVRNHLANFNQTLSE
jgi:hypothetical protein